MGELVCFCAGVHLNTLPAKNVKAILVNAPEVAHDLIETKRMLNFAGTEMVMLDSGGFQLLTAQNKGKAISFDEKIDLINKDDRLNLSPRHVIQTAAELKPNIVVALDYPIRKLDSYDDLKIEFFQKLGFNAVWARECSELRAKLCPEVQLFLPVQCYDLAQFDQYLNTIRGVDYDGLSMPVRNASIKEIVLFLHRFYRMGIRKVHILGTLALKTLAVAAYMARHYFDWVSIDATTWRIWAEYFWYSNPFSLKNERITQNTLIDPGIQMDCPCPFCQGKTFTFIKNLPETDRTSFLRSHNWWVTENAASDLYRCSDDVVELELCMNKRGVEETLIKEVCSALSLADAFKDADTDILQGLL